MFSDASAESGYASKVQLEHLGSDIALALKALGDGGHRDFGPELGLGVTPERAANLYASVERWTDAPPAAGTGPCRLRVITWSVY